MADGTPTTQMGWYADPYDAGRLRYWSGTEWSDEVRPADLQAEHGTRPWWQQWWAIGLTLLLCFPFGVIGVWQRKGTPTSVKAAVSAVALVVFAGLLVLRTR